MHGFLMGVFLSVSIRYAAKKTPIYLSKKIFNLKIQQEYYIMDFYPD